MLTNFIKVSQLNQLIGNTPQAILDWDALKRQYLLIKEELDEMLLAIEDRNMTELRDATSDVLVTTYGMAYRGGFNADTDMDVVHQSNMSKFCHNMFEVEQTRNRYGALGVTTTFEENEDGSYTVKSSQDQEDCNGKIIPEGKLLKSVKFVEPAFT